MSRCLLLTLLCGSIVLIRAQQSPAQTLLQQSSLHPSHHDEQRGHLRVTEPKHREKRFAGGIIEAIKCFFGWIIVNGVCKDPEPICDGKTTGNGGCDAHYPNSHLIDSEGNQITTVDGNCPSDNNCNCPMAGFYSAGGHCALCSDIANCNYETCSSSVDQVCSYCEGVVQDIPEWRAYKMSSDRRSCDQACSWRSDSNRCYPGTCSSELVGSCVCSSSFNGTHCRTITDEPDILYNALTLETTGTNEIFPPDYNSGSSATQDDVWTNDINPDSIMYEFHSQFQRSMPTFPAYIKAAQVGVSAASAQFVLKNKAGSQKGATLNRTCSGVSTSAPNTNILTCTETLQKSFFSRYLPTPFLHEDWLEFTYNAEAGGHVVVENKENNNYQSTDYFVTTTKTHTFQVHFDTVVPYHCLCSDSMLDTEQITTTADVSITWGGWADDAAGLWKFAYRVYDLSPINNILQHASIDVTGVVSTNTSSGQTTFTISGSPGIYAVILDAYDRAGNTKSARKLVLYDNGSQITRNPTSPLRVTSAASVTSWTWQQTEGPVTVTWDGRYTNVFHDHNKLLNAVAAEPDVESSYDDNVGNITVTHMDNALGIVKFTTAYDIDRQGGTTLTLPADSTFTLESDLTGTNTYQANVVDGDTLTFWVRAYDIRSEYDEESVTIHVDSSPPIIENLWLTKDHILNLSVHGLEELNQMTMEWEAYDEHSGLKVVQWRVFDNFTGQDIVHGQEFVQAQGTMTTLAECQTQWGSYIRGPNCYCTGPVGCFHQHFQVQPQIVLSNLYSHGGMFHDKNSAVHDYDYFMEVTVYNHANLSTTLTRRITVDLSPPHPGEVHDGMSGSPEVDYQATTDLHAYWWGFFDRESGVKYYQYAFDTACVDASAFSHDTTDPRVTETYEQFASWTAPGDGTYKVTVVAFNSAREPSTPVCSDGVIIDTVVPTMGEFFVEGAYISPGVVVPSSGGSDVYFMDTHRRLRLVNSPDSACSAAAGGVNVTLGMFATSPMTSPMNATEACCHGALDSKFLNTFYISRDMHLFLNWTGSDASSGIFDYEVGLATSSSAAVPDISGFQSTHHHTFYKQYHPTLTEGTPFYILIKAIDKAGMEDVQALGPVELVRTAPTYGGNVTLTLNKADDSLEVSWDNNQFTDVEPSLLNITVALVEQSGGAMVHPFAPPHFSGTCTATTPPSCATFPFSHLHWGLHEAHSYEAKVMVVNLVGFDLQLTSDTYMHDTRKAANGSVFEIVPSGEEATLGIQRSEDTDFQLDTSTVEAAWLGFEDGSLAVTYMVGLGTSAGASDIHKFVAASSQNAHMFTGLSLQADTMYYVTVKAKTAAGRTRVSSDGVTVIEADQAVTGIAVSDGPGCNVTNIPGWTPEHHADAVDVPCEDDASFQTSVDTLWAHWTLTSAQRHRYPDVVFKVQKNIPGTNSWPDVTTYMSSARNDFILSQGLLLQAGGLYRLAIKFCVSAACSLPVHTAGVYVTNSPLATGSIEVVHSNATGVSTLDITMDYFYDADISDLTAAQSAVLGYQWSLSHRLQDGTEPMLTAWTDVPALQSVNSTHGSFSVTLTGELSFHKCLIVTVRGISKVGLVTLLKSHIMDCAAFDPALIVPLAVLDTVGATVAGSPSEGLPVTMGFNDLWTADDEDYTSHANIISAVWPTLRQSQITWAVLESQGPDVTSHFLDPTLQPLQDPCTSPLQIACGQLTTQKYINVDFGAGSSKPALQNGHHYYVCVHAAAESITHEKWVEELPEVMACSDGITVDLTPPIGGVVSIDGLRSGIYQTSVSVITLRWNGFTDIEDMGLTAHHSGILSYQIAVGSVKRREDVLKFVDVGLVNYYTLHSLAMQDGHVYYVSVKAFDMVGRSVMSSSDGFVVDSSPPLRTSANFLFAQPYFTSDVIIDLCWTDMFSDDGSGIDFYQVTVGSRPGHDDIMRSQRVLADCGRLTTDVPMINGHAYYVSVGAVNGAGMETVATSKPVVVMTSSPSAGSVFDGPAPSGSASASDVDFVTTVEEVVAFWRGFATSLNPVASYSVSLGTCSGCVDVVADFDVGLAQEVTWNHLPLRHDIRYYTTVIACNAVDQCNKATSDGVMIDVTPPVTGPVWDGTGDEDIAYQSQRDFLGAEWRGFSDLGAGLTGFTWRAGTTTGGSDVMTERDVGLVFSAFTKNLPSPLPEGQTIFITVKATDAAGNYKEVTSNGFQVDTSAPITSTAVELSPGVGTVDGVGLVARDMMGVRWAIEDPESHIVVQHISVYSHIYGEFQSAPVQIPGPTRRYIITSLDLHDGSQYKVKVTACNLAHLCTTSASADILHDSSPPSTGMFAIHTDHTAELTRHQATWMQWTSTTLRLAWVGFHDEHSGVHSYHVNVGSTPFASDLNQGGTTVTVTHSNSGTNYEDEGYVQVYEVTTSTLTALQDVYVTIWAINGVGLKSHPAMSMFRLEVGGALFLHRRCSAFNCLSHCSCAVQGAPCGAGTSCTDYTSISNPNCKLTVYDHADLSVLGSSLPPVDSYQASLTYLAATWRVTTLQGQLPIRYEVSAGRDDQTTPLGVFSIVDDRVWRDVGLETSSIIIVPQNNPMMDRLGYSTFIRAWYADGSFAIFKSSGIIPRINGPTLTTVEGRAIKEHTSSSLGKDVDYVTSSTTMYISWDGKFVSTTAPVTTFNVYIGTSPEASNVFSASVSGNEISHMVTGLSLQEDTLYYSTLTAEGGSGLLSWEVSDGFILDTQVPQAGMVMDGTGLEDLDYQSTNSSVSANWRGFYDAGSGVRRYLWCVGTTSDVSLCDVMTWTDVGLNTSVRADLGSAVISQGTKVYSKVYAQDAAGQNSPVSVSDGVTVDTSAPDTLTMIYTNGINWMYNPSFETDTALNADLTQCDANPPTSWQTTADSCVTLHQPTHTVSAEGVQHLVLSGTLQQTVNGLTTGTVYRLTVKLAHPHNALASQKPVTGHVTMGTTISPFALDPSLCHGVCDTDLEPVMLWHSFSYIATATSTSMEIAITTSLTSLDQQVAVDDVIFEEIRQLASPGGTSEESLTSSGVFMAEWSVVQSSWHFTDDVSPIVDYQWALGTSEGGVQLQSFRSVGRRQHASLPGLGLTHGTSLYVTLLARNAAGMTTVAYSLPLTVDMTPPDIVNLWDGPSGEEVDFQTTQVISATWTVTDSQSSVGDCQWAIGTVAGKGDIQAFQLATPANPGSYSVSSDVTSALASFSLPVTLYVSVRCYNRAGLPARGSTDGVTIVPGGQSQQMGTLMLLPDSRSHFPILESCRAYQDKLRLRWGNIVSQIPLAGYQIVRSSGSSQDTLQTPDLPYMLEGADLNLNLTLLQSDSNYSVSVDAVDVFGTVTPGPSKTTYVLPDAPTIQANEQVTATVSGSDLTLSWPNLFVSLLDLNYEVTAGSVVGGGDILLFHQTQIPEAVVSLQYALNSFNMSVVVTAVDACGQYTIYNQDVHVIV